MNKRLKVLIIILVVIGLVFVYTSFSSNDKGPEGSVVATKGGSNGLVGKSRVSEGSEILKTLSLLKSIKLDTTFFEDENFRSLVDFSMELTPEDAGRPNPFSPFGVSSE